MIRSEKELCDVFIEQVRGLGFDVYPEYAGWDMVISRNNHIIGVQAKLKMNLHLLSQIAALEGVHFKVALTPSIYSRQEREKDVRLLLSKLKILQVAVYNTSIFFNNIDRARDLFRFRHRPEKLLEIPNFVWSTPAGVQSPRQVSQYIINLVKLELFAREHGNSAHISDIHRFGFNTAPRWQYNYDWNTRRWILDQRPGHLASEIYPHVYQGLIGNGRT